MDQKLLLLINREWTSPAWDRVMAVFSSLEFWLFPMVLFVLVLLVWGGFRGRAFVVAATLAAGLSDGAVSNPLKHFVNRPRPPQVLGGIRQVDLAKTRPRLLAPFHPAVVREKVFPDPWSEGRSFPSSHTMNTVAIAAVATLLFPRRGWLAIIPALTVAYSRIYTGAHWPSDVVTSLLLGTGVALLTLSLLELAWRRGGRRWWPGALMRHPSLLPA